MWKDARTRSSHVLKLKEQVLLKNTENKLRAARGEGGGRLGKMGEGEGELQCLVMERKGRRDERHSMGI